MNSYSFFRLISLIHWHVFFPWFQNEKYLTMLKLWRDHADKFKFGVVRHFVGHGVGKVFHAEPVVLHFSEFLTLTKHIFTSCCLVSRLSQGSSCTLHHIWMWSVPWTLKFTGNNEWGRMMLNQTFTIGTPFYSLPLLYWPCSIDLWLFHILSNLEITC
jgi:hypothetical protein